MKKKKLEVVHENFTAPRWMSKTRLRLLSEMFVNLAAGWIGLVLIAPGLWGVSVQEMLWALTKNVPLAILSLLIAEWLVKRSDEL